MAKNVCHDWVPSDVCGLVLSLLREPRRWFDAREVLNSDGRRLLERLVRLLIDEKPEYRRLVYRVRREPTLDNIIRFAERLLRVDPRDILWEGLGLRQPYRERWFEELF